MSEEATLDEFVSEEKVQRKDWETVKLEDVARKRTENVDPKEVDLERHVGLEHISPNTPTPTWESIDEVSSTKRCFESGDILFAKLRPNLEKAAQPDFAGVASTDIFPIVADESVNSKYLLYQLSSKPAFDHGRRTSAGTRMPRTSWNLFSNYEFDLPSLEEQRKISTVLYNIDHAIQKTTEIVGQIHQIKDGVMQDLFTCGINADGELRNPENSTHTFTKTPLGHIPESWECVRLGKVIGRSGGLIQTGPFGSQLHKEEYVDEGIPVVMPQDIEAGRIKKEDIAQITTEKAEELSRHRMQPNDVVIARRGNLKRAASISDREDGWLCGTGSLLVRPPKSEIDGDWFTKVYQHSLSQHQINSRAVGSTMSNLNQSILENLQLALPPVEEQERIARILSDVDARISIEGEYKDTLKRIKKGLMQDLLTGEIRTRDKEIEVLSEILAHG